MNPNASINILFLGILCLITSSYAFSQTPLTIPVSQQEFSVTLRSSAFDATENAYYAGFFKGALTIGEDTLMYGRGNNDLFILKMDSSGVPLWTLNIGSEQDENSNSFMLLQNNHLYVGFSVRNNFFIGDLEVDGITPGELTSILVKLDTSGNVSWVKKSNGRIAKIHPGLNKIVVECNVPNNSADIFFESQLAFTSNGVANQLFLSIDENGNYINSKNFYQNTGGTQNLSLLSISHLPSQRFYFLVTTSQNNDNAGNNRFFIGDNSILLPTDFRNTLLIKTDSAFNILGSKVLHPQGNTNLFNTVSSGNFRISDNGGKLNLLATTGIYIADGFNTTFTNSNNLISLDTSLLTLSVKRINQNAVTPPARQRGVQVVEEHENGYTIIGMVLGRNNSPINEQVAVQNTEVKITDYLTKVVNINGPSQTYLLRTNLNFETEAFTWIGSSSVYEQATPGINDLQVSNNNLYFLNTLDNTWAPWQVSKALAIKRGEFKGNADGPDYAENVGFFSDKTSYTIGIANGINGFDTSVAGISFTSSRRDVFISIFNANGTLRKYHRIFSSYRSMSVTRVRLVNDTLYAMVVFQPSSNQPGSNFLRIDTISRLLSGPVHRALFKIDKSGGLQYVDFQNTSIGVITDFDIYHNGDIAALTFTNTLALNLNGHTFPGTNGFYVAKLQPDGIPRVAVKIIATSILSGLNPLKIELERYQEFIGLMIQTSFRNNLPELQMVHARNGNQQSVKVIPNPMPQQTIQKNYLLMYRLSLSSNSTAGILGPVSQSSFPGFTTKGTNYLVYFSSPNSGDTLKYNEKIISAGNAAINSSIISLDSSLIYRNHLSFNGASNDNSTPYRITSVRSFNNQYYFSGAQGSELSFGALKIDHKGNGDGLTLKLDSALNVLQYFKVSSPFSEFTTDFAIHTDSTFMVGYRSQTSPAISIGQNSMLVQNNTPESVKPGDLEEVGFVILAPANILPNDFVISVKNGGWNEPATWQTGKVPTATDRVFVKHKVQINTAASCFTLFVDPGADLQIAAGNEVIITGKQEQ